MQRVAKANSGAASVGVISKVLRILEALQGSSAGLGLKAICDLTGIHKSTAHRFLKHLEREGYLIRTEAGAYLIGPRLAQMSARGNQGATLQAVARPILWELWKATQETVNLAVLDQGTMLYVDVMESPHEFRLSSRVGHTAFVARDCAGKSVGRFSARGSARKYFEHDQVSASDAENHHEPGAVPPGTREDPAARLRGRR